MSTTTNDALARAIEYLDAQLIQENTCAGTCSHEDCLDALYAFRCAPSRWQVASADALRALGERRPLVRTAEWEADWEVILMPRWWSPSKQFAWRIVALDGSPLTTGFKSREAAYGARIAPEERVERITVNLDTGEEVSA